MLEKNRKSAVALEVSPLTHTLISWRAIFGGVIVTALTFIGLIELGMALGGVGLREGTSMQDVGMFTGLWFLLATVVSLLAGGYFAARISPFHTTRVGSAHGLVIGGIFFSFMLWQAMGAIGWMGSMVGSAASAGGSVMMRASDNPIIVDMTEDALGDLNLKSDSRTVIGGVAGRLLRGDLDGAKAYLSRQSGITPAEADQRLGALKASFDQALSSARDKSAATLRASGWSLFLSLILGALAAAGGGALGARANLHHPISREQAEPFGLRPLTV